MANRVSISTVVESGNKVVATIFDESYQDSGVISFKDKTIDEATKLLTDPATVVATVLKYGNAKAKIQIHNASTSGVDRFAQVDQSIDTIDWSPLDQE